MPLNALKNSKWLLNSQICEIEKKNFDKGLDRSNATDRLNQILESKQKTPRGVIRYREQENSSIVPEP